MTLTASKPTQRMPRIAECGSDLAKSNPSVDTVIRKEIRTNDYGRATEWTLSHRSIGYTPAGSCMRWQDKPAPRCRWMPGGGGMTLRDAGAKWARDEARTAIGAVYLVEID